MVAVVVPKPGEKLTEDEIISYCKERLAKFEVPKKVIIMTAEQLPVTSTGKIQKFRLREMVKDAFKEEWEKYKKGEGKA